MIIFIRKFSTCLSRQAIHNDVRVRFAPSPTGNIHFGGLRTALYNYIFARQNGGKFILRIEDTDQTRIVQGSRQEIENILSWSGLEPDESPNRGGPFGPYVQSERLEFYHKHIDTLLQTGKAYRCFCSPSRLELLRKHQANNREKPRYDGKCKFLSDSEIFEKMNAKESYTVRFSLQSDVTTFDDMIFGLIETDFVKSNEGDPIILKSDKWPTYHFANVVDDHEMQISHVFRGSEWISSTAKHIQLYKAFNWNMPRFAHLPLITMQDGSKMSKRNNQSQIATWIQKGYMPLAVLNILTNMGGGVSKDKQDSMEIWDLPTIINNFDFAKVICHPGSVDSHRLDRYNYLLLRKLWKDDPIILLNDLKVLLSEQGISDIPSDKELIRVIDCFSEGRMTTLKEITSQENDYLWNRPQLEDINVVVQTGWNVGQILTDLTDGIETVDIDDKDKVILILKRINEKHKLDWGAFLKFIRFVLTNRPSGQPVYDIFRCLGKNRLLDYLGHVRDQIK